jgi:hypothetical protein
MIRDTECVCETVNKPNKLTVLRLPFQWPVIDKGNWSSIRSCSQEGLREPCPQRIPLHPRQNSWWNILLWWNILHNTHTCKARITTVDKQQTSSVPEHTHDVQNAETEVHVAKQNLKRRAATQTFPTRSCAPRQYPEWGSRRELNWTASCDQRLQTVVDAYDFLKVIGCMIWIEVYYIVSMLYYMLYLWF